jgi:hypothetical protein
MIKDKVLVKKKQRYLDAMTYLAKVIKEAKDKNPSGKVLNMGICMREVLIYVAELESRIDDFTFDPADYIVGVDTVTKRKAKNAINELKRKK